jgi:tetratricopeptide (TPR) repeat protein
MQNGVTMQANLFIKRVGVGALGAAVVALMAACASSPKPAPEVESSMAASGPQQGPLLPPTPAAQQQSQKTALLAVDELEDGHEDDARAQLQKALMLDPGNKLALSLMRQLSTDPVQLFGRDSFSYTVKAGESLSKIAGRFMGDIYLFYGLARYNDIKVPKQVGGGQLIRVPGKTPPPEEPRPVSKPVAKPKPGAAPAPAPVPAPEPAPPAPVVTPVAPPPPPPPKPPELSPGAKAMQAGEAAERSGNLEQAMADYKRATSLDQPAAVGKAEAVRKQLVNRYATKARGAFARQDLDGAISNWNHVLELDPGNDTAKLEKQKAAALKEKVKALK